MKKNIIFLVIDSLSREYTENYPLSSGNFFEYLDEHSICARNMYSTAPFTEGGGQGLWNSVFPLETFWGNRLQPNDENSIFSMFQQGGYEIYFTDRTSIETYISGYHGWDSQRIRKIARDKARKLMPQIKYYLNKGRTNISTKDAIINMLDVLFSTITELCEVDYPLSNKEAKIYYRNKDLYYDSLLMHKDSHTLFEIVSELDWIKCGETENVNEYPIMPEELLLAQNIAYRNDKLLKEYNQGIANADSIIKRNLEGKTYNRCIWSSKNILELIRMDSAVFPDSSINRYLISSGIYEFIEDRRQQISEPYFAYFHEYSFHYPEMFLNACKNEKKYKSEIEKIINLLPRLHPDKISILKALSLLYISEGLSDLVRYLENKGVFEDTYLVITADHGISNFMYPLDRNYRWMFYKENFHVPFWILGHNIEKKQFNSLCLSKSVMPTLAELCGIEGADTSESLFNMGYKEYILTEWMNDIPDIEKEYIKFGYRNEKISLTYCVRLNQLFQSGRILTLFDLKKDFREYHNLGKSHLDEEIRDEVNKAVDIIYKRWDKLRRKYLDTRYVSSLDEVEKNMEICWLKNTDIDILSGKSIAVYGTDSVSDMLLSKFGSDIFISNIVDISSNDQYYKGRPICKDKAEVDKNELIYIIACEDEIEALLNLYKWRVRKVYVYTGKQ